MASTLPAAVMIGLRGGGTDLPAQKKCLELLLGEHTKLHPRQQLAEIIGSAVLAGEISLLAAQATGTLAKAHKTLGR
jgi:hydroxymethylglutaryl-CoA reductase (NADPH)